MCECMGALLWTSILFRVYFQPTTSGSTEPWIGWNSYWSKLAYCSLNISWISSEILGDVMLCLIYHFRCQVTDIKISIFKHVWKGKRHFKQRYNIWYYTMNNMFNKLYTTFLRITTLHSLVRTTSVKLVSWWGHFFWWHSTCSGASLRFHMPAWKSKVERTARINPQNTILAHLHPRGLEPK